MSRRGLTILGLAAAGGAGYYLYSAGGDPKVAQKQLEADASKASAKIKSEVPGKEKEAEKKGEALFQSANKEVKNAEADAKKKLQEAQSKLGEYKDQTGKELNKAIDKFDNAVTDGAKQAKSGVSSWFGGGSK